jgi:YidC/Oxa1 family membrane protein insertase
LAEISNPNLQGQSGKGSGGDSGSLWAFTLLFLVVLLGYQYFFKPPVQPPSPPAAQSQSLSPKPPQPTLPAAGAAVQPQLNSAPVQAVSTDIVASVEATTTVENDKYRIVFSNRGAEVISWVLKNYYDSGGKAEGRQLDLVQHEAAERDGFPLSLFTYEQDAQGRYLPLKEQAVNQGLYQLTVTGAQPTATGNVRVPATSALTFHYRANGLEAVKTIRFDSSYVVTVESQVTRNGSPVRSLVAWPAGLGDMEEFNRSGVARLMVPASVNSIFAWSLDGKQDSTKAKKVSGYATLDLPYQYAAVADLYFAAAFMPDVPQRATAVTLHDSIELPNAGGDPNSAKRPADLIGLAVGDESGYTRVRLFAGPKQNDILKSIRATGADGKPTGPTLEPLVQYTWLAVIAKPLYLALHYLKDSLGPGEYNWGWAIIIVTFIINLCMLPTRYMMLKSSFKMMGIQDKIAALKKRYEHLKATDPKRAEMNTEMMALYKSEGVNPYGSCLPMLIQMPILYGIYRVLANAVELRQAHWFWLTDLSSSDPLHILPIIIILGMFLTQYITPSPAMDKSQQRMMAFMMPAMFGFMMWNLPSGLSLYWGTGSVINMAIQLGINQTKMGREMHAKANKRAAKKAGTGPITVKGKR